MGLKKFNAAVDALPEKLNGEELADFVAALTLIYMPAADGMRVLAVAAATLAAYLEEKGENAALECTCPRCMAERAEQVKH